MKIKKIFLIVLVLLSVFASACGRTVTQEEAKKELEESYDNSLNTDDLESIYNRISQKSESVYYQAMEDLTTDTETEHGTLDKKIWMIIFGVYSEIRAYSIYIGAGSIFVGILSYKIATKNKQIRRRAVYFFCVGVPLALIVFVYGVGILAGVMQG